MNREKAVWIYNGVCDDPQASLAHCQDTDDQWRIIVRTNTGISIIYKDMHGDIITPTAEEFDEFRDEDVAFGLVLGTDGGRSLIGLSEDGEVMYNPDDIIIDDEEVVIAGSTDELDELIEDGEVSDDVYEALDSIGCLLY